MPLGVPTRLSIWRPGGIPVGTFKVFGEGTRQLAWQEDSVSALQNEFVGERPVRLSNPIAGITGAQQHAGGLTQVGVADVTNGDTSRDDIVGAGAALTSIALSSASVATATKDPGTAANRTGIGTIAWASPNNAKVADAAYATAAAGASNYLQCTNFGFALAGSGPLVRGVEVKVLRHWQPTVSPASGSLGTPVTGAAGPATISVARPAVSTGDLMIAAISTDTGGLQSVPAGWTVLTSFAQTFYYYKVAGGAEPSNYSFTSSAGTNAVSGTIITITGLDPVNPIATKGTFASAVGNVTAPGITTVNPNEFVCLFAGTALGAAASLSTGAWSSGGDSGSVTGGGHTTTWTIFEHPTTAAGALADVPVTSNQPGVSTQVQLISFNPVQVPSTDDVVVQLVVGGVVQGTNAADTGTAWPYTAATKTYGGDSDTWGLALTQAQVQASDFGVVIAVDTTAGSAGIDLVEIVVHYATSLPGIPSKIWADGADANGQLSRYIYALAGSKLHVIDPVTDVEVETTDFGAGLVNGGDAAYWAGRWFIALRGGASDFVRAVAAPYNGSATRFVTTDFTATALASGASSLYRAYVSGVNKALVKKTTSVAAAVAAIGTLTLAGNAGDGETVVIGTKTYTWKTVLDNVDGHVFIGADASTSIDNLIAAITLGAGAGTLYATATTVHPTATASAGAGDTMVATAIVPGLGGNSIATTETMASGSWGAVTMAGGTDAIAADANWTPASGEQAGDPAIGVNRIAASGDRLLIGKEDGLGEFDQDFTFRFYLDWMRAFRWSAQCNGILPLGVSGDFLVTFKRGLWMLPRNVSLGVEKIPGNESDKRGHYQDIAFDGNWIYAALHNENTGASHILKMRVRTTPQGAPGLMEHHPILTVAASGIDALFLWPGAEVNGVTYGPRLYFGVSAGVLGYIRLGETQPDQADPNWRTRTDTWSVEWPISDYGNPRTMKLPFRLEASGENLHATPGIRWSVREDSADPWVPLTTTGDATGSAQIVEDGLHRVHGPRDSSFRASRFAVLLEGDGSLPTAQQRVRGLPILTLLEQPEQVRQATTTLQLEGHAENDDDALEQWRKLDGVSDGTLLEVEASFIDEEQHDVHRRFFAYLDVKRASEVSSADEPGVILATATLRALNFFDNEIDA